MRRTACAAFNSASCRVSRPSRSCAAVRCGWGGAAAQRFSSICRSARASRRTACRLPRGVIGVHIDATACGALSPRAASIAPAPNAWSRAAIPWSPIDRRRHRRVLDEIAEVRILVISDRVSIEIGSFAILSTLRTCPPASPCGRPVLQASVRGPFPAASV